MPPFPFLSSDIIGSGCCPSFPFSDLRSLIDRPVKAPSNPLSPHCLPSFCAPACAKAALALLVSLVWWRTPVAELPPGYAWPLNFLLAAPHGKLSSGSSTFLGSTAWLALCMTATCAVLEAVLDMQRMLSSLLAGAHGNGALQQRQGARKDE